MRQCCSPNTSSAHKIRHGGNTQDNSGQKQEPWIAKTFLPRGHIVHPTNGCETTWITRTIPARGNNREEIPPTATFAVKAEMDVVRSRCPSKRLLPQAMETTRQTAVFNTPMKRRRRTMITSMLVIFEGVWRIRRIEVCNWVNESGNCCNEASRGSSCNSNSDHVQHIIKILPRLITVYIYRADKYYTHRPIHISLSRAY